MPRIDGQRRIGYAVQTSKAASVQDAAEKLSGMYWGYNTVCTDGTYQYILVVHTGMYWQYNTTCIGDTYQYVFSCHPEWVLGASQLHVRRIITSLRSDELS